jgi:hypothetical protein
LIVKSSFRKKGLLIFSVTLFYFSAITFSMKPSILLVEDDYNLGFSYDIFSNQLSSANLRPNGFEISFSKSFGRKRNYLYNTLFD